MDLLTQIKEQARGAKKRIILPESHDGRTLRAARIVADQNIAEVILVGERATIDNQAKTLGIDLADIPSVSPLQDPAFDQYVETLYNLRKDKGLSKEQALEQMKNPLYYGTMKVYTGAADGMVAGAVNTTGDVLRPALQIIKTHQLFKSVSGAFLMMVPNCPYGHHGLFVFADCAVNVNPDARTLAEIGIQAAYTGRNLGGFEPVVSFLSFSTKGSAKHELVDKVVEAVAIAKTMDSSLQIDGELQLDAALVPVVGSQKAPGSLVAGKANVLVFPDLQSGNIGYKLVERLANAVAVGPILQGMAKPVNDLSRGCNVDDIINMIAITAVQAIQ